ncbi:DUF4892 domain-containing protein [Haliea sp.]
MINPALIRRTTQLLLAALLLAGSITQAEDTYHPAALLQELERYPHAVSIARKVETVRDHEIGLDALQKSSGDWIFRRSERLDGELARETWQIIDGFAARRVLQNLEAELAEAGAELLYSCDARACGPGAQWASRVFNQRILYGRADEQRYRVYAVSSAAGEFRVVFYSGARTTDRQYLHVDVLKLPPEE